MMDHNLKKKIALADFQLFLLAIIWGGGFVAGKIALETTTPFYQIAYRYIGASLCLLPLTYRHLKKLNRRTFLISVGIGALLFVGNCFQTIGLQYTTPAKQSFIVSSYTVLVPLLTFFIWKEKPSKQTVFAAVLAMVGIGILTLNKNLSMEPGDILTMVFAFTFSLQVILAGKFVKELNIALYTFFSLSAAGIFAAIGAFLLEAPVYPTQISAASWVGLAYLAILNTALAFFLQNAAQRYAPATHTALIMSLETVFGTIFSILIIGETFTLQKVIGCVIMFSAIILAKLPISRPVSDTTDRTLPPEPETPQTQRPA